MVQNLVQKAHPYVLLRGNTYYFRFATPQHVRKLLPSFPKEIKRSLRTDSYSQAVSLIGQKLSIIKLIYMCTDEVLLDGLYCRLKDFSEQFRGIVELGLRKATEAAQRSIDRVSAVVRDVVHPEQWADIGSPLLSTVWTEFSAWKDWKPKLASSNQRMYENLKYFVGDLPVTRITKQGLREALALIAKLPLRNKKEYRGLSLSELSVLRVPEDDRVSGKYVREHLKLAQSLFSRYLVKEKDVLDKSPTDGLKWEYEDRRFASLSDKQVKLALLNSKEKPGWFQWFLLLAVYSGARRSEIAGLRAADFKLDDDSGRYYFILSHGKTKAARRRVPVHKALVREGLIEWLANADGLLFPIAKDNPNRVTDLFGTLLEESVNDMGERIVLHSVRHTFITKVRSAGVNDTLLQQVVGHEMTSAGITDRYTHTFPIKDTLKVVDSFDEYLY